MSDTTTDTPTADELGDNVAYGPQVAAEHSYGAQYDTRVTLSKPIRRASAELEPITVLYLREPTAGDLRGIKLAGLAQFEGGELAALLPRISMPRLAPAEVNTLGLRDLLSAGNAVARFLF